MSWICRDPAAVDSALEQRAGFCRDRQRFFVFPGATLALTVSATTLAADGPMAALRPSSQNRWYLNLTDGRAQVSVRISTAFSQPGKTPGFLSTTPRGCHPVEEHADEHVANLRHRFIWTAGV